MKERVFGCIPKKKEKRGKKKEKEKGRQLSLYIRMKDMTSETLKSYSLEREDIGLGDILHFLDKEKDLGQNRSEKVREKMELGDTYIKIAFWSIRYRMELCTEIIYFCMPQGIAYITNRNPENGGR